MMITTLVTVGESATLGVDILYSERSNGGQAMAVCGLLRRFWSLTRDALAEERFERVSSNFPISLRRNLRKNGQLQQAAEDLPRQPRLDVRAVCVRP